MIRGWRNDPKWVEYYERKRAEYFARQVERVRVEGQMREFGEGIKREIERSRARLEAA